VGAQTGNPKTGRGMLSQVAMGVSFTLEDTSHTYTIGMDREVQIKANVVKYNTKSLTTIMDCLL
jgi:hypothetical protein